jgi:hypothetical protein
MKTAIVLFSLVLVSVGAAAQRAASPAAGPTVEVFKSATCGCCNGWVEHLRSNGFTVRTTNTETLDALKTKHQIPAQVRSCHTGLVGGYVVEGHVPAADIHRLLKERPAVAGIGVPGMPIGSPGMEVAGVKPQAYDVVAFTKEGTTRVFASHGR